MRRPTPTPRRALAVILLAAGIGVATAGVTLASAGPGPAQKRVIDHFAAQAKAQGDSGVFSFDRGSAFFHARPGTGRPATPSCTVCHTQSPLNEGHTRAGKAIAPMALSRTPTRFTDLSKVEKWFRRNCKTVYGRACTAQEKGDFLTFMTGQ